MPTEDDFLSGLEHADDAHRLVYADWLEERGRVAQAEYLRAELRLRRSREQLAALAPQLQPGWCEAVSGEEQGVSLIHLHEYNPGGDDPEPSWFIAHDADIWPMLRTALDAHLSTYIHLALIRGAEAGDNDLDPEWDEARIARLRDDPRPVFFAEEDLERACRCTCAPIEDSDGFLFCPPERTAAILPGYSTPCGGGYRTWHHRFGAPLKITNVYDISFWLSD